MFEQIVQAVAGIERDEHRGMPPDAGNAHQRHRQKPDQHDRTEEMADLRGALGLDRKQRQQDHHRGGNDVGLERRGGHLQAFERRQHRDRRRDRAVAVDQRSAEKTDGHNGGPLVLLYPEQGHQRQDAAFAVIVDAHGEPDIFHGCDDEERPQHQRQCAQDDAGVG